MKRLRNIIEIVAMPLVLTIGFATTVLILFLFLGGVAAYLGWLIGINMEGPSAFVLALDVVTFFGILFFICSRRVRAGAAEIWRQLSKNL